MWRCLGCAWALGHSGVLLVPGRHGPERLLSMPTCTGQASSKDYAAPNGTSVELRKPHSKPALTAGMHTTQNRISKSLEASRPQTWIALLLTQGSVCMQLFGRRAKNTSVLLCTWHRSSSGTEPEMTWAKAHLQLKIP